MHLRRDKGLSVSAIRGFQSALNSVFALKGQDLAASRELSLLLRSFRVSCPPAEVRPPAWDLCRVLESLKKAPYEPLNAASERSVGLKALFLLALASAKRVGELHGLSYRVSHSRGWKEMSLCFVPSFVAKTQDPSSADPRFEGFSVPALPRSGHGQEARLLCPVRALRRYLDMTAACRPTCERLFVSPGESKHEISKNSVSYWIRRVISRAYEDEVGPSPRPLARETRGIGPSLLFKKNYSIPAVLRAGTWRRQTTFSRFYLRDLASRTLDTYHLGPVVAAQEVV